MSRLVLGVATVLVGAALVVIGIRHRPAELQAGPNRFLSGDQPGIDAQNTPAVATDQRRPDVVAMGNRVDTPMFSCGVTVSSDGGRSWRPVRFSLPPDAPNCYWPDVAFDDQGHLLVLYTATGGRYNLPVSVWLQRLDGEVAREPAVRVVGPLAFHAHLDANGNRVLVTWVQAGPATVDKGVGFAPPHPLLLARSLDGGRSFLPATRVSEHTRRVALPTVLSGNGDEVIVGALDLADDALDYEALHDGQGGPPVRGRWRVMAWSSADGGQTFRSPSTVADFDIPQRVIVNLGPAPGFARDPARGRVYATWDAGLGGDRDVFLAWSDDSGATWAPPTRVVRRQGTQHLPAVGVAPDGRVDLIFYDRSRDPEDVMTEVTVASSWDRGRSFVTTTVSDRPFDSRIGFGSAQGIPVLGSHLAVSSRPGHSLVFWADTRRGTLDTNRQDLALAVVTARPNRAGWWPGVVIGAALLLAGAVRALLAVVDRPTKKGKRHLVIGTQ